MSHLDDLEKKLYKEGEGSEAELEKRTKQRVIFRRTQEHPQVMWSEPEAAQQPVPEVLPTKKLSRKTAIAIIVGGGIGIIGVALGVWFLFSSLNSSKQASFAISGRSDIESGELVTIPLEIKNTLRVGLHDVEISL